MQARGRLRRTRSAERSRACRSQRPARGKGSRRADVVSRAGSWRCDVAKLLDSRRPDSRDRIEVVNRAEGTVFLAVVEDLLSRDRADSGELVELLERCDVQVNGTFGR